MNVFYRYLLPILVILNVNSCSSSMLDINQLSNQIQIYEVQAWLNLMPGGPGSFHVSGKYELPEELDEKKIFLDKIIVTDNEKEIYSFIAELHFVNNSANGQKEFVFTNPYQTKINPILMQRDSIDVELIFSVNGLPIKRNLNKIPLTLAY